MRALCELHNQNRVLGGKKIKPKIFIMISPICATRRVEWRSCNLAKAPNTQSGQTTRLRKALPAFIQRGQNQNHQYNESGKNAGPGWRLTLWPLLVGVDLPVKAMSAGNVSLLPVHRVHVLAGAVARRADAPAPGPHDRD